MTTSTMTTDQLVEAAHPITEEEGGVDTETGNGTEIGTETVTGIMTGTETGIMTGVEETGTQFNRKHFGLSLNLNDGWRSTYLPTTNT